MYLDYYIAIKLYFLIVQLHFILFLFAYNNKLVLIKFIFLKTRLRSLKIDSEKCDEKMSFADI